MKEEISEDTQEEFEYPEEEDEAEVAGEEECGNAELQEEEFYDVEEEGPKYAEEILERACNFTEKEMDMVRNMSLGGFQLRRILAMNYESWRIQS